MKAQTLTIKIISTFCFILLSNTTYAYQFKHLKLGPLLQERAELLTDREIEKDTPFRNKGISRDLQYHLEKNNLQMNHALGLDKYNRRGFGTKNKSANSPLGDEVSPLFQTIVGFLSSEYQGIGEEQTGSILQHNGQFNLGTHNFSGFSWQKPMGNFSIGVDRQLAPDLFDDQRWIVSDKFVVYIDASTFLHNMEEVGLIDITKSQIAAFAGVEFKREYVYYHFADSFMEGLVKDLDKLFLGFLHFQGNKITQMAPYEYINKKDYLSAKIGAGAHVPIVNFYGVGLGFNAAVMAEYSNVSSVEIQSIGPNDYASHNEKLRISFEKNNIATVSAEAQLQAEFFALLKLTLLSFEYEYGYSDAEKIYLSFKQQDIPNLTNNSELAKDVKRVLNLRRPAMDNLHPFIVSRERRTNENSNAQYNILLFGGMSKRNTEQVKIEKDGVIKTFFKNRSENLKYVRGFIATLLNSITQALFKTDLFDSYKSTRGRKLAMEYQGDVNIATNKNVTVDSPEKLSLVISHEYTAKKTHGFFDGKYKKYAVHFAQKFTSLPSNVVKQLDKKKLRGPLRIKTTARVNARGLSVFNRLSKNQIKSALYAVCKYNTKKARWRQSKQFKCAKTLGKKYISYINEYRRHRDMSLPKLKDFLIAFNKLSDHRNDLRRIFGPGNVFYNGSLEAQTSAKHPFLTYFSDGKFDGLGVIDNFMREGGARVPASIAVEY